MVKRAKIDNPTHEYTTMNSLSWLGIDTSNICGRG